MQHKERLDVLLVERGLSESREKAKATIMAGLVFVDGQRCDKAGTKLPADIDILVKGNPIPYVGRGGLKSHAGISLAVRRRHDDGYRCLDRGVY